MNETNTENTTLWSLTGEFENIKIDERNRLNIPAQHRDTLKSLFNDKTLTFIISKAPEADAIRITPKTDDVEEFLSEHPEICYKYDTREADKNNRILIAEKLLTQLQTDKYTLIGNGHRLELWNATTWRQEKERREQEHAAKADGVEYVI